MQNILKKAEETHILTHAEIVQLLCDETHEADLLAAADRVRQSYMGDAVELRGIIEFSNRCKNNCHYCGIRRDNAAAPRYRLTPDEILNLAQNAVNMGFQTVVMQSGEDPFYTTNMMVDILLSIKKLGVAITLSVGEKTYEEYKAYKDAGADRFLLRIETTDRDLYHKLDPGMNWDNRHRCLVDLDKLGYEVGSGIMVGLPGQTIESIADDLLYLQKMGIDMAGIGPFIPTPNTPLEHEKGRELHLALRTMAIMRLLMPDINIPATTAMEALHPLGRVWALQGGANVVMPNVTSPEYKQLYQLYPGKTGLHESALHGQSDIGKKIADIGRTIATGPGVSPHWKRKHSV